jgi:hypothetical protein
VSGYRVMGLTSRSGDVLGLRRWTASSVGAGIGDAVDRVQVGPIATDWEEQRGIFAIARVFVTRVPDEVPAAELTAEVLL